MNITDWLAQVKQEAEKATKEPWEHCVMAHVETPEKLLAYLKRCIESGSGEFYFVSASKSDGDADVCHSGNGPTSKDNNSFIAHSRTNVPKLVRLCEAQARVLRVMGMFVSRDDENDPIVRSLAREESNLAAIEKEITG